MKIAILLFFLLGLELFVGDSVQAVMPVPKMVAPAPVAPIPKMVAPIPVQPAMQAPGPIAPIPGAPIQGAPFPAVPFDLGDDFGMDQEFDDFVEPEPLPGAGLNFPNQMIPAPISQQPGMLPGKIAVPNPQGTGTVFPVMQTDLVKAMDSVALQAFADGTRVVFLFVGQGEKNARLLKVTRGIYVAPTGKNPFDPKCQFVVLRKGNWIGFKSDYLQGKTLQSDPKNFVVHCPNNNFSTDTDASAHWSAQFVNPQDISSVVSLQNRATQGFLSFPYDSWAENLAWTALKERIPVTIAGERSFLKIVKVTDLPKEATGTLGGKEFLYTSRLHKKLSPMYCEEWKFKVPGKGVLQFEAQAKGKIVVGISTVAESLADQMYYLVIGDQKGKCSTIRKQIDGPIFYKKVLVPQKEASSMKGQELQSSESEVVSYWVEVDAGKISYGIGPVVGQNTMLEWQDPDPLLNVQYVGFSGGESRVMYKNIIFDGKDSASSIVILPREFQQEAGSLKQVAVGYFEGNLEMWGIGLDGKLWRWNEGSIAQNPWVLQKIKDDGGSEITSSLDALSVSSIGDVFIVIQGKVYRFNRESEQWSEFESGLQAVEMISVSGHQDHVWAVGKDGVAYQYNDASKTWEKRSDLNGAQQVVVSPDNEVFVLNKGQNIFQYRENRRWRKISTKTLFRHFFAINKELLFGIDDHHDLWQYTPTKKWARVAGQNNQRASGFINGAGNVMGMIALLDQSGNIYKRIDQNNDKKISVEQIRKMMKEKAPSYKNKKKLSSMRTSIKSSWKRLKEQMKNNEEVLAQSK